MEMIHSGLSAHKIYLLKLSMISTWKQKASTLNWLPPLEKIAVHLPTSKCVIYLVFSPLHKGKIIQKA